MPVDTPSADTSPTGVFRRSRDLLIDHRSDYDAAYSRFAWPVLDSFNWATDWFDAVVDNERTALRVVDEGGADTSISFAQLSDRSRQLAGWMSAEGVGAGDPVLLLLGNRPELWEMMLACMRLGAVMIPATVLLSAADISNRLMRGHVRHVVTQVGQSAKVPERVGLTRMLVGGDEIGWKSVVDSASFNGRFEGAGASGPQDPMLRYFTSGTTSAPKLVEHSHTSYPVGHLSTMYWIGLQPSDVHLNVSSPGWAKHAWSNVFAPWNAECTVVVHDTARFSAPALLDVIVSCGVTSLCAPPTVWRMLIQEDLSRWDVGLRNVVSAGEPLNPEVIDRVEKAWGLSIRDGYGQTETTAIIGNTPGQALKVGSVGRPLPGYKVTLVDPTSGLPASEGEIGLGLEVATRPAALMTGYVDDGAHTVPLGHVGYYLTGDIASADADGYITYVGRSDDVFKASDYRISPFELESVLMEHPAVAEAAVVPSPDPLRLATPKAFVALVPGVEANRETALSILQYTRAHLAPYKRIRSVQFLELPKTISGKIRRVELKALEATGGGGARDDYREAEFPELAEE